MTVKRFIDIYIIFLSQGNNVDATSQPSLVASEGPMREVGKSDRGGGSHPVMSGGRGADQSRVRASEPGSAQPPRGRGRGQRGSGGRGQAERPTGAQMRQKFGNGVNGGDKTHKVLSQKDLKHNQ